MTLRERLLAQSEPDYRAFASSLLPGVEHVMGVRIPKLRRLAREIARGDWRTYLRTAEELYFEERMLQGLVIGYAPCDAEERLAWTARFVPKIDNWSVCDSFCRRLNPGEREPMWRFVQPYFRSPEEFGVRFAVVTSLVNFADEEHLEALLARLEEVRHEAYYARMGVAWAVSVCFAKFPERTAAWLADCALDDWTYGRSLRKIVESDRVDASARRAVRAMRRRGNG